MDYKFRTNSIHSEVQLIAGEFDRAPAPKKNDYAAFLSWFMEEYPNCKPESVFRIVKKNFLDMDQENPVRRKCAKMLGEIGSNYMDQKLTPEILELLLNGMKDNNPHTVCECIDAIGRMASVRRWQDFDHVILPLLERIVDASSPNASPSILDSALDALSKIKPNEPDFLDKISEVKAEVAKKKSGRGKPDGWDNKIRRLEEIRHGWASILMQRGKWEEKKVRIHAQNGNGVQQGNNGSKAGRKRRIVTP